MAVPSSPITKLTRLLGSSRTLFPASRTPASTYLHPRAPTYWALYSTASKERGDPPTKSPSIPPWLIYVLLPVLGVFGTLTFLKSDESDIRRRLKDENKVIGRAHDCHEVHEQDIDKWTSEHPDGKKHSEHWHALKKEFKKHADASGAQ